ncbi:hypothetical protein [Fimbriiglobus ruber]|uniref:Uncharacterized protein n=1 Tax=Fimbriiglobus ruber TaxID=1908690 RepID=A0A225DI37_9BACT|nr:hypothetical protein [Fimbriiglobus ruber]OWK38228.1 hypothetical protein FRUB_07348 [Fimbriiglobus ruber]
MTSFVEFHGFGFWCRNAILADWLDALTTTAALQAAEWPWLTKAGFYWAAVRSGVKSQRMTLYLDADANTPEKQIQCEELFEIVSALPLAPPVRRCALLCLALIRGEITGTRNRSIDLWASGEWDET